MDIRLCLRSFQMGDDGSPIEFSWVIESDDKMTVRFTVEPLSLLEGSPSSPTTWMSCLMSLGRFSSNPDFDISWGQICFDSLVHIPPLHSNKSQHASQFSTGTCTAYRHHDILRPFFRRRLYQRWRGRKRLLSASPAISSYRCLQHRTCDQLYGRIRPRRSLEDGSLIYFHTSYGPSREPGDRIGWLFAALEEPCQSLCSDTSEQLACHHRSHDAGWYTFRPIYSLCNYHPSTSLASPLLRS